MATLCTIPLVIGFALPVALLARLVHAEPGIALSPRFVEWAWNSLRVAGVAAVIAVVFAGLVAYALRLAPGPLSRTAARVLGLGYAVPGTVLAVGVLLPLGAIDGWHRGSGAARDRPEPRAPADRHHDRARSTPTWYATSPSRGTASSRGSRASRRPWTTAARSLGAGTVATFRRVHAPLLGRSAAAALLLVFVDVMKELPATLVLRPFNFDTLATQAYAFARDERLAEAALPSLAIVAVGLIPIVALARATRRRAATPLQAVMRAVTDPTR